ncbi:MAG TPA: hypothetical protein VLI67_11700 [Vicinamibacteria bacterium]|nr:hypothetical protein [Vicinamibacteria bacterium]
MKEILGAIALVLGGVGAAACPAAGGEGPALRVLSERTVGGFEFPESVECDVPRQVLYVSQFVSALKPTEKDGQGKISKVSLTGEVLEDKFLPGPGDVLHKPKGIWAEGNRLWVTDIDVAWVFDLTTRQGRKVALPGVQFANDPTVNGNALYVSDNRGDQLFRVEPADFLDLKGEPRVTRVLAGKSVYPNGLWPAPHGVIITVGRGISSLSPQGELKTLSPALGRLDGVYLMDDMSLLVTDWNTGALAHWSPQGGMRTLTAGFKGPADFCVMPDREGLLVVVPDLVQSQLRFIRLPK